MAKKQTFSDQLRRAVEQSEMTRYRISQETGIPEGNLSRFAHGTAGLSLVSIDKLCECLGVRLVNDAADRKRRKGN